MASSTRRTATPPAASRSMMARPPALAAARGVRAASTIPIPEASASSTSVNPSRRARSVPAARSLSARRRFTSGLARLRMTVSDMIGTGAKRLRSPRTCVLVSPGKQER